MRKYLLLLFLASCARAPLKDPEKAFRPAAAPPALQDFYPIESLREAWSRNLLAFASSTTVPAEFRFAGQVISRDDYRRALEALGPEFESFDRLNAFLQANFQFFEVYGDETWAQIFSTAYYNAAMKGSRKQAAEFSEPIYAVPPDMVSIDLKAYGERLPDVKPLQDLLLEQKSKTPSWRGRLVKEQGLPKIVPYYQRSEIQRQRPLAGQGLELAWVNPIDAFFLEIQGSGTVEFKDGKRIRLGYGSQNGCPYTAIGKFLLDVIPKEQISAQRIRAYLAALTREQQQDIFDKNCSFVFFKEQMGEALGHSGSEVTAERSIATDSFLFPQGVLGFMEIEHPIFADATALDPVSWEARPRWVFNQDTGGAIKGGGRVDLYMGSGPEAERAAGVMKRKGRLWMVAPKKEFLDRLRPPL